jgi:hypothetical protein
MYSTDTDAHAQSRLPSATTSSLSFAHAVRHTASDNTPRDRAVVGCSLYGLKRLVLISLGFCGLISINPFSPQKPKQAATNNY